MRRKVADCVSDSVKSKAFQIRLAVAQNLTRRMRDQGITQREVMRRAGTIRGIQKMLDPLLGETCTLWSIVRALEVVGCELYVEVVDGAKLEEVNE